MLLIAIPIIYMKVTTTPSTRLILASDTVVAAAIDNDAGTEVLENIFQG
jgi:hypothetical protein